MKFKRITLLFVCILLICTGCLSTGEKNGKSQAERNKESTESSTQEYRKTSTITFLNSNSTVETDLDSDCEYSFKDTHTIVDEDGEEIAQIELDFSGVYDSIKYEDLPSPETKRKLLKEGRLEENQRYMILDYNNGEMYSALFCLDGEVCFWMDCHNSDTLTDIIEHTKLKLK